MSGDRALTIDPVTSRLSVLPLTGAGVGSAGAGGSGGPSAVVERGRRGPSHRPLRAVRLLPDGVGTTDTERGPVRLHHAARHPPRATGARHLPTGIIHFFFIFT